MNWLIDNWSLIIVGILFAIGVTVYITKFMNLPSDEQMDKIRSWLLYACLKAEKEFGGGTGKLKLHAVYDAFIERFPQAAKFISFDSFSVIVDTVLIDLRKLIASNKAIKDYIEG